MITDYATKLSAAQVVPVTASTVTPSTNQLKLGTGMKTNLGNVIGPKNLHLKVNVDVAPTISTNANGSGAEPAVTFQLRGSQNADMTGNVILLQSAGYRPGCSAWAASTAYTAGTVAAKTGHVRRPTTANGFQYRCTTGGSASAEIIWAFMSNFVPMLRAPDWFMASKRCSVTRPDRPSSMLC